MFAAPAMKVAKTIPMLKYFHPHPVKTYSKYLKQAQKTPIFFHQNHGVFITSDSISQAVNKAELLEANFKIYFTALSSNQEIRTLSVKEKTELSKNFN